METIWENDQKLEFWPGWKWPQNEASEAYIEHTSKSSPNEQVAPDEWETGGNF